MSLLLRNWSWGAGGFTSEKLEPGTGKFTSETLEPGLESLLLRHWSQGLARPHLRH